MYVVCDNSIMFHYDVLKVAFTDMGLAFTIMSGFL